MTDGRAQHPLREAAFARLWAAGLLAEVGEWVLQLALPLYVLQITDSPLITSVVAMIGLLPSLVTALFAGAVTDRWDHRSFLVLVSALQAAMLLPLLAVQDAGQLWVVYLVAGSEATLSVTFRSVKNVTLATLVAEDQLVSANASIGLNSSLGRLIGSPVGGLLLSAAGLPYVVAFGVGAFLGAATLSRRIPPRTDASRDTEAGTGFWRGIGEGLSTVWKIPALRATALCVALLSVAQGLFVVLFLLFVTDLIGGGDAEAGVLRGVQALGGFAGTVTTGLLMRRIGVSRLLAVGVLCYGVISAATWNLSLVSPRFWVFVTLFTAAGIPAVWLAAAWLSLIQQFSPLHVRGRVMGSILGLSDGLQAVGMLTAGMLTGMLDTVVALNVQAGLLLVTGLLCVWTLRRPPRDQGPRAAERRQASHGARHAAD
ncbi:MFS transporter [Streptomyces humi]|uniref:MFS transporter n=1 Tax=Streptomyces humi TaxID=1428620 RepID=UPI00062876A1|nr:MFS transporter [Streptomyces humi]